MENLKIENAHLIFRNFSGKPSKYNAEGDRNFGVLLDPDVAEQLKADGWNVKHFVANAGKDDEHEQAWIKVKVRYGAYPPHIFKITGSGKRELDEDNISQLDWQRFTNVDLEISPYSWSAHGTSGIAAYLNAGYFTIMEDAFADKYSDIPELD